MRLSIRSFLAVAFFIAISLAIGRQLALVNSREIEIASLSRVETSVRGEKYPSNERLQEEIRIYEAILTDYKIPLTSTRFKPEVGNSRTDPSSYFRDEAVQQLCLAIGNDDLGSLQKALDSGVDLNSIGDGGVTPLLWALEGKKIASFIWLLNHGATPNVALSETVHIRGG